MNHIDNHNGVLIAFEGIDGSGKSTQIRLLAERLQQMGISFYTTMEPSDAPIGSMIRQILTGRMQADPKVIAALFTADRLDHLLNDVNGVVRKIENGTVVLMDRYYFSSYAYQSVELPMDWLIHANEPCKEILRPEINLFLDIEPKLAMERISKNRFQKELFEEQSRLEQVRQNYLEAFDKLHGEERVIVINGNQDPQAVADDIWMVVQEYVTVHAAGGMKA